MPSLIRLSSKGWINSDLFLEWFQHFIESIPPQRPVVLFTDSHEVLSMAGDNVTFPAHTTHLLQPLVVGVYRPLKEAWRKVLSKFMVENPGQKPDRYNFSEFLAVAYRAAFQATTVSHSFAKTGIFPLDRSSVSDEAIAPSLVTERTEENGNEQPATRNVDHVLQLPACKVTLRRSRADPSA